VKDGRKYTSKYKLKASRSGYTKWQVDIKAKIVRKEKEDHYILINGTISSKI
jgi:hypothetical protein